MRQARRQPQQRGAQTAQHQRPRLAQAAEFLPDLSHDRVHLLARLAHEAAPQRAPHVAHACEHRVQHLVGQGDHEALRIGLKSKCVHVARRHVDQTHGPQRHPFSLQVGHSLALLQQQQLVQFAMPVRRQLPAVQGRSGGDGLAVHDIGQLRRLAKQAVGNEDAVVWSHVRIVQVLDASGHSERGLTAANCPSADFSANPFRRHP
jgi:hypothetical protein